MASRSEENLRCSICHDIYKDPVILSCSHSFCRACLQRQWTGKTTLKCPICKKIFIRRDPPLNLALKNLCEDFLLERAQRPSTASVDLCSLHNEELKLFCLAHQQPVCLICLHSEAHTNHSIRPINEAAWDYKRGLQELLRPLKDKLELFNDIKGNFDQTAKDIEVQAQDTERQIKGVFWMLQKLLQKEEEVRIAALREERKQKSQMMRRKQEALNKEISALSDTVRDTEEVLKAKDLIFLQNYNTAAGRLQLTLPEVPEPTPVLMDMSKHLNNLSFAVLGSVKEKISTSEVLDPKTNSEPLRYYPHHSKAESKRRFSLAVPESHSYGLGLENGPGLFGSDRYTKPNPPPPLPRYQRPILSSRPPASDTDPNLFPQLHHRSDQSAAGTPVSNRTDRMRERGVRRDAALQHDLVISQLQAEMNRNLI